MHRNKYRIRDVLTSVICAPLIVAMLWLGLAAAKIAEEKAIEAKKAYGWTIARVE